MIMWCFMTLFNGSLLSFFIFLHKVMSLCRSCCFGFWMFLLYSLPAVTGQVQVVCSRQPIIALVGSDVILACHLDPATSADSMTVKWTKPGLDPENIHVHQDGRLLYESQNSSHYFRTRVFVDELLHGNVSLKIFNVKRSDEGKYRVFIPSIRQEAFVQLIVGAASSPVVHRAEINSSSTAVVLQCESSGWYPEPELLWLDGDGNLLSAGPTETVRGPDDLYTVSSRVTVEKKHNNNVTCRVQQNNEHRDAEFHVTDDFFTDPSAIPAVIGLILFALVALGFALCAWRQNRTDTKEKPEDEESQSKGSETESLMRREKETQQEPTMLQEQLAERGDAERASTPVTRETANQSLMNENTKETLTEHSDTSAQKPTKGEEEKLENPSATETKTKDTKENSGDEESQSKGSEKESLMRREKETQQEPTMFQEQLAERGDAERASTSVTRETASDEQSVKSEVSSESEPERQQDKDHRDEENTEDQTKRAEAQQQSENNEAGKQLVGTKPDIEEEKEANKTNECDNSSKIQSENQEGTPSPGTTESRTCQENVSTSDNRNSRSDSDENSDTSGPNPTEEDNKQPGDSSVAEMNTNSEETPSSSPAAVDDGKVEPAADIKIPETSGNDGEAKTESEEVQNPGSGSAV